MDFLLGLSIGDYRSETLGGKMIHTDLFAIIIRTAPCENNVSPTKSVLDNTSSITLLKVYLR